MSSLPVIFRDDFTDIDLSRWELYEYSPGTVAITGDGLQIIDNQFWHGSLYRLIERIDAYPLEIEFSYKGWGTDSIWADGFTCVFYKDDNNDVSSYRGLGIGFGGKGYCVEFDNYYNSHDPTSKSHIALMKDSYTKHLKYTQYAWDDGQWANCLISIYPEGGQDRVTVTINNNEVLSWLGTLDRNYNRFGFSAATGDKRMYVCLGYVEVRGGEWKPSAGIFPKVDGAWEPSSSFVKVGGSWRPVEAGWVKDNGVWKPIV